MKNLHEPIACRSHHRLV